MTSSPRAVLLDADGVLQHPSHDWEAALADVGGAAFPAAVFEHERPAMRGEMTMREALLAAAQAVEHYEITRYGTLIAWAKQLGRGDAASILAETLAEEQATDTKLNDMALSKANAKADMATA